MRLGSAETELQSSRDAEQLSAAGLTTLKSLAAKHPDSLWMADFEVAALLSVMPATLRDSSLAISWAEREAILTKRKQPGPLLSVAQAYRSAGQIERARTVANEGQGFTSSRARRAVVAHAQAFGTGSQAKRVNLNRQHVTSGQATISQ